MSYRFLLFVTFAIISGFIFAQEGEGKANVELPDFVITGKDKISFPPAKKIKPDIISALSLEFINPPYKADDFSTGELSNPESIISEKKDSTTIYHGYTSISFGNLVIPALHAAYAFQNEHFLIAPYFSMINFRDFEPLLGYKKNNAGISSVFNTGIGESIFNGLTFKGDFSYYSDSRKVFRTIDTAKNRNLNIFSAEASVHKDLGPSSGIYSEMRVQSGKIVGFVYDDSKFDFLLGGVTYFNNIGLTGEGGFSSNSINNKSTNYLFFLPGIQLISPGAMKIGAKLGYTEAGTHNGLFIKADAGFSFKSGLGISVFYEDGWRYSKRSEYLLNNPYTVLDTGFQMLENFISHLKIETKYEFMQYFEASVFFKIGKTENINYFLRDTTNGVFRNFHTDVSLMAMGIDAKFHNGPFGYLYGILEFVSIKDSLEKVIPYIAMVQAKLIYGTNLSQNLSTEVGVRYKSSAYIDEANVRSTVPYFNLSLSLMYKLKPISELMSIVLTGDNLLNQNAEYWEGYPLTPIDIRLGIELKF